MVEQRFFFRDGVRLGRWLVCPAAIAPALIYRVVEIVQAPPGTVFKLDWVSLFSILPALVIGVFALLVWKNERLWVRENGVAFTDFLGRSTEEIPYSAIESFRLDGYPEQDRYFAIISDRRKIRVPASAPDFPKLAFELRRRHFGENKPPWYPEWQQTEAQPVEEFRPPIPWVQIALGIVGCGLSYFCFVMWLPISFQIFFAIVVGSYGLGSLQRALRPASSGSTSAHRDVVEG